ncbi:MAG: SDR family NAD(P)-dependent oxidoreductase [Chloroflexi bacterium]|nr:SDR family NAD(P)-dependent oxidoreductase [Chloroflexota bacterium]MDA1145677.1 SDR family NAD(P)-dependent oxidoreductase [Chloroflexota bacterium]
MAGRLEGKVAIVTGAGRGIGRGEALALAKEGAAVVVNDLGGSTAGEGADSTPAQDVVNEIEAAGGKAVANCQNVTDYEASSEIIKQALDTYGQLDIVVNNAGILRDRMIFNMSEEEWDSVISVHLKGTFNISKHASVLFRQQRSGRFINTGSESGLGSPGQPNYGAAKEGITAFTRSLASSMSRYDCTANSIRPRAATRMTLSPEMEAARQARVARGEGRDGDEGGGGLASLDPNVVGMFVSFLASDAAQHINGGDFLVGGNEIGMFSRPTVQARVFSTGANWEHDEVWQRFPDTIGKLFS